MKINKTSSKNSGWKKSLKDPETPTTITQNNTVWAPLKDILDLMKHKGIAKTADTLRKEVVERGIRVRKMIITKIHTWNPIWCIPLADYQTLVEELRTLLYIFQLNPKDPEPGSFRIKIGKAQRPEVRRYKFKTVNPDCTLLWIGLCPGKYEQTAIAYATSGLAIQESKESFMCLNERNIQLVIDRLERFCEQVVPFLLRQPLNKEDYYYDAKIKEWLPKEQLQIEDMTEFTDRVDELIEEPVDSWADLVIRLKIFREKYGKSQRWVADQIGISDKSIGNYERNIAVASLDIQEQLKQFLDTYEKALCR